MHKLFLPILIFFLPIGLAAEDARIAVPDAVRTSATAFGIDLDIAEAPAMQVSMKLVVPVLIAIGGALLALSYALLKSSRAKRMTGSEDMIGKEAKVIANFSQKGKVFVNGEIWQAELVEGFAEKNEKLEVVAVKDGLVLEVKKVQ